MLNYSKMEKMMNSDGYIQGYVTVSIHDIIDSDFESFLDILSEGLTGSPLLMGINYNVDHSDGDDIIFYVTGDASDILDVEYDDSL